MKYKVITSQTAYFQISECISFLDNVSPDAALRLYNEIMNSLRSLEEMPDRCPVVEEFKTPLGDIHRMVIANGKFIILYRIDDDTVYVNYVVDTRKDIKNIDI